MAGETIYWQAACRLYAQVGSYHWATEATALVKVSAFSNFPNLYYTYCQLTCCNSASASVQKYTLATPLMPCTWDKLIDYAYHCKKVIKCMTPRP